MKPIALVLTAALVAALTAYIVVSLASDTPPSANAAATSADAGDIARRLDAIDKHNADLGRTLDDLRMQLSAKEAPARVPVGEIEAAIQRVLAERGVAVAAAPKTDDATSGAPKLDAKSVFAELASGNLDWDDALALWKRAGEAGLTDEVLAMFEDRAKQSPNDPKAQTDLGRAYLQKVFKATGPEAGTWATKADKAFDKALSIDDHNWDARFTKAMSLTFWPPVFGKQQEAITNFETLVQQQQGQAQQPQFAQTHLLLGNMYLQANDKPKALAAWQNGLTLFPGNAELMQKIASLQAH